MRNAWIGVSVLAILIACGGKKVIENGNLGVPTSGWAVMSPVTSPTPTNGHAMAFDSSRGVTILSAQCTASRSCEEPINDTWEWTGVNWVKMLPAASPPVRGWHAMAFDSSRRVTVLFGGLGNSGALGDTWEWDGLNWIQASPTVSPQARMGHAMTFDSRRGVTVVYGGQDESGTIRLGDTWEWDGVNWSLKAPTTSPPAREAGAMVFDAARGVSVLFVGAVDTTFYNDTWEWDGMNWNQTTSATSPPARSGHAMAYDSSRKVTVLFGGDLGEVIRTAFADTWEHDGLQWIQRISTVNPGARYETAIAYDSLRGASVLFSGAGAPEYTDTWEWYGSPK